MSSRTALSPRDHLLRASARIAAVTAATLLLATAALAAAPPGVAGEGVLAGQAAAARSLTTTGPLPPRSVAPATGARRAVAAAGETVLSVPVYMWRDGCAPTATGMVLGYWDGHGFPDLVPGDASTDTPAAYQMIASHGAPAAPGHYEDYALPRDDDGVIQPDKSQAPAGDEHAGDSVADFMHTSFSADRLAYGWSHTDMVGPAFVAYADLRLTGVTAAYEDRSYGSSLTFTLLRQEIDAGRPLVLSVDSSGDGRTDHAVAGIGYRETNGYPEYACWDTWYKTVRWQRFRGLSNTYAWGVYGATTFTLTEAGGPSPSPLPSTPPAVDATAPVTGVTGAGGGWSRRAVMLEFPATDTGSGVAFTEAALDEAVLAPLPGLPATLSITAQGEHTVFYRSTDKDGNVEVTRTCTVRIDGARPVTSARAARVRRGARVKLRYRVVDLTPTAKVRLVIRTREGRRRATLRLGWRGANTFRAATWRCTLPRGTYRVAVYAKDEAGNRQATPGAARLTVL